jgi:hypothetical protein
MPDYSALNSTTSAISSFGIDNGGASWFSLVVIVILATVTMLLFVIAMSSITQYKRLRGFLKWIVTTVQYFFFGLGGIGVLSIPCLIGWYFVTQAKEGNTVPVEITGYIIAGYFAIAGFGYIVKKYIVERMIDYEEKINKEENKEEKKNDKRKKEQNKEI